MRIFFLIVLALHVLVEGLVGLVLILSPTTAVPAVGAAGLPYLLYYGGAGITMALAAVWLWPHRHRVEVLGTALGIFATFHSAQTLAGVIVASQGGGIHIILTHGVFALCFWILWVKRRSLCAA